MPYKHKVGGSSPSFCTISVEMIYTDWIIDYDTEKRMDIRQNTLECDGTPLTKSNRASERQIEG